MNRTFSLLLLVAYLAVNCIQALPLGPKSGFPRKTIKKAAPLKATKASMKTSGAPKSFSSRMDRGLDRALKKIKSLGPEGKIKKLTKDKEYLLKVSGNPNNPGTARQLQGIDTKISKLQALKKPKGMAMKPRPTV